MFTSVLGKTKSIEIDMDSLGDLLRNGYTFDGSSVPGYAHVNSSDKILRATSSFPINQPWDLEARIMLCAVHNINGEPHPVDPRNVLRRVLASASSEGFHLEVGGELEFFLVNGSSKSSPDPIDSGGYFDTPPSDGAHMFRRGIVRALREMEIPTTAHHHEVAMGQHEICVKHSPAIQTADNIMLAKMAIAEMAHQRGMIATFMPKPFSDTNGSGMHLHQSLWDSDVKENLFATEERGVLSEVAGHYVAGLLEHAPALAAIVAPTVNSYKRLRPGYEAPTLIAWGPRNRSVMVRIPMFFDSNSTARIEFRCPDPSCSPHLAIAAMIVAGLDGVRRSLDPPSLSHEDLFEMPSGYEVLPSSLHEALAALEKDRLLIRELGDDVVKTLVELRSSEWREYAEVTGNTDSSSITEWEVEKYLLAY